MGAICVRDPAVLSERMRPPSRAWRIPGWLRTITAAGLGARASHPADSSPAVARGARDAGTPSGPAGGVEPLAIRTAFDFLSNRVHAVVHRNGRLLVPAGE